MITISTITDFGSYIISQVYPLERQLVFETDYYCSNLKKYKEMEATIETETVFIGDSLTSNFNLLKYFPELNAINGGIPGDTSTGLLNRITPENFEKVKNVIILIGYNDLKYRKNSYIAENIKKLASKLYSSHIYIISVLPVAPNRTWFNKRINNLNSSIYNLCSLPHTTFIDAHAQFIDSQKRIRKDLYTDRTHLNEKGYAILSKIIKHTLQLEQNLTDNPI
ncbi:MAG: GDSL-type esterase/lipase family protein [Desulfobulbaceae bacterium]|nr:GDSL-type esterase/lipase family protein [Desulfobulbaceae bacterium]